MVFLPPIPRGGHKELANANHRGRDFRHQTITRWRRTSLPNTGGICENLLLTLREIWESRVGVPTVRYTCAHQPVLWRGLQLLHQSVHHLGLERLVVKPESKAPRMAPHLATATHCRPPSPCPILRQPLLLELPPQSVVVTLEVLLVHGRQPPRAHHQGEGAARELIRQNFNMCSETCRSAFK